MRLESVDLVLEGQAARVTDGQTLEQVAAIYREGGWPAEVEGDAFTAPGQGISIRTPIRLIDTSSTISQASAGRTC